MPILIYKLFGGRGRQYFDILSHYSKNVSLFLWQWRKGLPCQCGSFPMMLPLSHVLNATFLVTHSLLTLDVLDGYHRDRFIVRCG